jgi:abhydrolase domain-containing protein 12
VAQGWRTDTYRNLILQPNTHVVTIDYRGFGHSTGSPTEAGLIADGTALVNWVIHVAGIPPERIALLGQSLGTAVSSAVALNFVDPSHELIPRGNVDSSPLLDNEILKPTAFAGVILVAPFSSLPSLLLTYRLGGLVPLLLPLRPFPVVGTALTSRMTDKWPSAKRLAAYYRAFESKPDLLKSVVGHDGRIEQRDMGVLQIIHAKTDMDISYHQTEMICAEIFGDDAASEYVAGEGDLLLDVKEQHRPRVRVQIVEHGGKLVYSLQPARYAEANADNCLQATTAS